MGGLFNLDNPLWRFMGKLADLMLLNLLWILCSIPIVTMGASTTAVYYVTLKLVKDEEGYTARSFFKSFKENFKQSTIMWLIILVVCVILGVDLRLYISAMGSGGNVQRAMAILFFSLAVIFGLTVMYVFPLQAKFINPIKRTFINAFFMSIRHLPYTLLMIVITVFYFGCVLFIPQMSLFVIVFGITLPAFLNSYFYEKIFERYIPKDEKASKTEELSMLFADEEVPPQPEAPLQSQVITEEDVARQKADMAWRNREDGKDATAEEETSAETTESTEGDEKKED
ncbi:MAG: DUF624 domain-containing protein [bacterium]|nr:DUF624 domain-containing protein [bacterium]